MERVLTEAVYTIKHQILSLYSDQPRNLPKLPAASQSQLSSVQLEKSFKVGQNFIK